MKRRRLALRHFVNFAEHLRAACLVEPRLHARLANRFENADSAEAGYVRGVFGNVETNSDVALRGQMVNLVRLNPVKQFDEIG